MRDAWFLIFAGVLVCTPLRLQAAPSLEADAGQYVYEGLQGAVAQAVMLDRLGLPAWEWGDRALLRAFQWLHEQADYPAEGDDTWMPHVINRVYGTDFPAPVPARPGKAMGFTDWTHALPVSESNIWTMR